MMCHFFYLQILTMLINSAYKPGRVLRELQVVEDPQWNCQEETLKAKYEFLNDFTLGICSVICKFYLHSVFIDSHLFASQLNRKRSKIADNILISIINNIGNNTVIYIVNTIVLKRCWNYTRHKLD